MTKNTNLESKCIYTDVVKYEHIALKTRRSSVTRGFLDILPALDGGILNTAMSLSVPACLNKFNRPLVCDPACCNLVCHRFRDDFFALISIVQITDKTLKSNMASVKIHELIQSTLARHDTRFDTSISLFKFNGDLKRTFCRALTSSKAS